MFIRTLVYFVCTLLVSLTIVIVFMFTGFRTSSDSWAQTKRREIERHAAGVIKEPSLAQTLSIPEDVPVFVYDAGMQLLYSNRGAGRRRLSDEPGRLEAVYEGSRLLGYYQVGSIDFHADVANRQLFDTLRTMTWFGVVVSGVVSIVAAMLFSRSLSRPARLVATGLDRMSQGNLDDTIPETGTQETARIARSANNLRGQLLHEQQLRSQWAQDIAHDLRTPVSALKAQLEAMHDGVLEASPQRIRQNLGEIVRVEKLINDLEELMKLETPDLAIEPSELNVRAFVDTLVTSFASRARDRGLSVTGSAAESVVRADEDLLYRAVSNVVANAVRYADVGGSIGISAAVEGQTAVITVHNTGDSIPAAEIPRLFDRLYRGERARCTAGSGLGLTIARQILDLHGGTIRVATDAGSGTSFQLRFPAR